MAGGKAALTEGRFTLATRINFPAKDNVVLEGMGRGATTITAVDSSTIDSVLVRLSGRSDCSVRHLTIDGNKANQTASLCGLYLENCNNCDVEDVAILDTTHVGLYIESTSSTLPNFVRRVIVTDAGDLGVVGAGSAGLQLDNDGIGSIIEDMHVTSSSGHGFVLGNSDYVKLIRPRTISNTSRGISATAKHLEIMNPYAASNGGVGMQIHGYDSVGGHRIIGGVTQLNGTAASFSEGSGLILTVAPHSEIIGLIARYNAIDDGPNENGGITIENCDFCKLLGCVAEYNGGPGITLYMASDCRVIDCTAANNGNYASAGMPYGIVLGTDGVTPSSRNVIALCRSYDDDAATQTHGLSIRPGAASSDNKVVDCNLEGNATLNYDDSSGGTGNVVINTPGYVAGTVNTGVTAVEATDGRSYTTTLTVSQVNALTLADNASIADGYLLFTFPAGALVIDYAYMTMAVQAAGSELVNDTPDVGLGTVIGTGAVATLDGTGTFEDIITGQTAADADGTATVKTALPTAAVPFVIESGDAHTLHFNVADAWADDTGGDLSADIAGTVVIAWRFLA